MSFYHGGRTPQHMFSRQLEKQAALSQLVDRLQLSPGDRVLEVGSGPGLLSLLAAEKVGPKGRVWALDLSKDALSFLSDQCAERQITWLQTVVGDAADSPLPDGSINRFFVSDMLHDADAPSAIVAHLGAIMPRGATGAIGEYRPVKERSSGPPLSLRIPPDELRGWLEAASFSVTDSWSAPDEHYGLIVEKH